MDHVKEGKHDVSSLVAMRRVTLLLDGLSRSAIVPFGPYLVHRILFVEDDPLDASWSQVAHPFAITLAMYCLGRWIGTAIAERMPLDHSKLVHSTARVGGATIALHVFSYGAGLSTILWLVIIRFVSGMLAGFLCRVTNVRSYSDDDMFIEGYDEELGAAATPRSRTRRGSLFAEISSSATVMYTAGVALSLLLGGLFYEKASHSKQFHDFTGAEPFILTPMFFVLVSVVGEACLRLLFWWFSKRPPVGSEEKEMTTPLIQNIKTGSTLRRRSVEDPLAFVSPAVDGMPQGEFFDPLSQSRHKYSTPNRNRMYSKDGSVRSRTSSGTAGRPRINSATSYNSAEFFDCESFGGTEEVADISIDEIMPTDTPQNGIQWGNHSSTDIAVYRDGKTVYPCGSPAFVPAGECEAEIPDNVIRCWGEKRAKKIWLEIQKWRREKNIWRIHAGPHKLYPRFKEAIFQSLHGYSKAGLPIIYEKPGTMKLKGLFGSGVTIDEMQYHYFFMTDFIYNVICAKDEIKQRRGSDRLRFSQWSFSVVMDFEGISMSMLSTDLINYMTKIGDVSARYYPLSTGRIYFVNAPFWLAGAWAGMKKLAPASMEVEICSRRESLGVLLKYIDRDQIPAEYGGTSPYATNQHPYELEMSEVVGKLRDAEEFESQPLCDTSGKNRSYSFSYPDQQWMPEDANDHDDVSRSLNSGSWKPEISASPSLRRRAVSIELHRSDSTKLAVTFEDEDESTSGTTSKPSNSGGVLVLTSFIFFLWFAIHGAMQSLLPLYILTPPILGGLGYTPCRGGVSLFCASILVQYLMRTKLSGITSQIPRKAPMRALRTGVGLEAVILMVLPLLHNSVVSVARVESVVNMISTVVLVAGLAVTGVMGMGSITILHRIACENFVANPNRRNVIGSVYGHERLRADCQTGKFAFVLRTVAEILGILAIAPLYSWSTTRERPTPLDAACCFFVAALVSFVLYVLSFSLRLNVVGEFVEQSENIGGGRRKRTCAFGDLCAVPMSDVRMILEEANVSITQ